MSIKIGQVVGGLPQLDIGLSGWEVEVKANFITQEYVDGKITDISNIQVIKGVLQPLKTEDVNIKPEGQRNWIWQQLHVKKTYPKLRNEQIVEINDKNYKIMAQKDYTQYGYVEYHLVEDYQ